MEVNAHTRHQVSVNGKPYPDLPEGDRRGLLKSLSLLAEDTATEDEYQFTHLPHSTIIVLLNRTFKVTFYYAEGPRKEMELDYEEINGLVLLLARNKFFAFEPEDPEEAPAWLVYVAPDNDLNATQESVTGQAVCVN